MKISFRYIFFVTFLSAISIFWFSSCNKVNVTFDNSNQAGDPSVTYYNDFKVSLQTLQIDSFITSGKNTFCIGYHMDPYCGSIYAGSYAQVNPPSGNPIYSQVANYGKSVTFDSLELILTTNGTYYGDTTKPVVINVYPVTQLMQNYAIANTTFYNTSNFSRKYESIGKTKMVFYPNSKQLLKIRLADTLGVNWLNQLKTNAPPISNVATFINSFKGIYIDADSTASNTLYGFKSANDSSMVRLYYHLNGLYSTPDSIDFLMNRANQFSHIQSNNTGTPLAQFTPGLGNQVINSSSLNNKAYLNSSMGKYITISMPNILTLKATYPYVKILSAQLVVPPVSGSFPYPDLLPPALNIYAINAYNQIIGTITTVSNSSQSGNLFIDYLYGQNTMYTYDVTNYVSSLLAQGYSSTTSILLSPSTQLGDESFSRLIVNDQTFLNNGIQLRLYVLGI
jgi:hypothetical protein